MIKLILEIFFTSKLSIPHRIIQGKNTCEWKDKAESLIIKVLEISE